jgi:hypothetical protein
MGHKAAAAVGLKADKLRLPSVAAVARSRVMRLWLLRATTTVLLWTCVVQLTAVGETWGPRVLRGWPSCRMAPEARRQLAVPGHVVDKEKEAALPPKSECCYSVSPLSFLGFQFLYALRLLVVGSSNPLFLASNSTLFDTIFSRTTRLIPSNGKLSIIAHGGERNVYQSLVAQTRYLWVAFTFLVLPFLLWNSHGSPLLVILSVTVRG